MNGDGVPGNTRSCNCEIWDVEVCSGLDEWQGAGMEFGKASLVIGIAVLM